MVLCFSGRTRHHIFRILDSLFRSVGIRNPSILNVCLHHGTLSEKILLRIAVIIPVPAWRQLSSKPRCKLQVKGSAISLAEIPAAPHAQ